MRWSLRTKILIILSTLLLIVVTAHLILSEKILREDKELLIYDSNRSNTEQLANELDNSMHRVIDKMELLAELVLNNSNLSKSNGKVLAELFIEKDPDLLVFQIIQPKKSHTPIQGELLSKKKIQAIKLSLSQIHNNHILPISFDSSQSEISIENRSIANTILYLIRVPVQINGTKKQEPIFAQALIDGRSLELIFRESQSLAVNFAVTHTGQIFTHPNLDWVTSRKNLNNLEIVKKAQLQQFTMQQMVFDFEKKSYMGVYQKTTLGSLTVISMIDKSIARRASRILLEKTMILSLIIVTVVLLISLFFAGSLSTPLLSLVDATKQISLGNFDTPIDVHTQDEIGVLALAFSKMTKELKSSRLLLEEYNRDLSLKVHERTQELESKNAAIRQQHEVLIQSTHLATLGEIAGKAAHEVLNPLTAMISNLEKLLNYTKQLSQSPSTSLSLFKTILDSWREAYHLGGLQAWLENVKQPSRILPGKSLLEEDIENLNLILGQFSSFTQKSNSDLQLILSESHRISRIVDQLRGLSRTTRLTSPIDINTIITDSIQVTEDLLARYKIKIETRLDESPLYIVANDDEMRQIFFNLIKNSMDAIHASNSHSGGRIQITTQALKEQVKLNFWDNGIGIPLKNRDKIFESDFSTKGAYGTGFGLGICRRFARAAGGEIIVKASEPGKFTEFELTFPRGYPPNSLEPEKK